MLGTEGNKIKILFAVIGSWLLFFGYALAIDFTYEQAQRLVSQTLSVSYERISSVVCLLEYLSFTVLQLVVHRLLQNERRELLWIALHIALLLLLTWLWGWWLFLPRPSLDKIVGLLGIAIGCSVYSLIPKKKLPPADEDNPIFTIQIGRKKTLPLLVRNGSVFDIQFQQGWATVIVCS